ncbi:hypothetical protein AJ80_04473 [Polytolypa hystricis UAMH7299]|uniref:Uncharacterized protein n=1 Tax=Polytolypa hystricis (strain UAMH7299) TaxID=1447883 RepID=A0A2B7YBU5_POLH7|nr:hypothetical protein AJ80_04473 [Polytolypa hystricis UAMH7299]
MASSSQPGLKGHNKPSPSEPMEEKDPSDAQESDDTKLDSVKSDDVSEPQLPEHLQELLMSLRSSPWEQLQERFVEEMEERSQVEMALQKDTSDLLDLFMVWSQTTIFRDEDRAYKRFKTRMAYTQNSESVLEEKKKHYTNVVKAFESALALLRGDQ